MSKEIIKTNIHRDKKREKHTCITHMQLESQMEKRNRKGQRKYMKNNNQEFFKINMIDTKPQIQETQEKEKKKKKKTHMQISSKSLKEKHRVNFKGNMRKKIHYMQRKKDENNGSLFRNYAS